jgi:hypothetical protein
MENSSDGVELRPAERGSEIALLVWELIASRKDWSALADDFRAFLLMRDGSGSIFQQFTA